MAEKAESFRRRVAFSETDASGRVHFTEMLKWAEDAEHQTLEGIGVSVCSGESGWPRVKVECDYRHPLFFGEEVEVVLQLSELGRSSLRWSFRVLNQEGVLAAEGKMVTVAVTSEGAQEISAGARQALEGLLNKGG